MKFNDLLCDVPNAISNEILTLWLRLENIPGIDSAYCNRKRRSQFLHLLSAPECVFPRAVYRNGLWSPIPWIIFKTLKVSEVVFSPRVFAAEHQRCLEIIGSNVKSITYSKDLPLELCAQHCRNLTSLTLDGVRIDESLLVVLLCNPQLQELRILPCLESDPADLSGVRCPNLRLVSISRNPWSNRLVSVDAFALSVVSMSENIQYLDLQGSRIADDCLLRIAAHCPRLRALGLAYVSVSSEAVLEVCGMCPDIAYLDVRSNGVNFTGVADFLPPLRALAVGWIGFPRAFISTNATTLHTLHVSQCLMLDIAQIVAGSPLLCSVAVTTRQGESWHNLNAALAAFTNITTLSLQTAIECVWESVADNCPNVTQLGIFGNEKKYGRLSTVGLDRVLAKCSGLRTIAADMRSAEYLTLAVRRCRNRSETVHITCSREIGEFQILSFFQ